MLNWLEKSYRPQLSKSRVPSGGVRVVRVDSPNFFLKDMEVAKVARLLIPVPDADDANAERNQQLFDWASAVLKQVGIEREIRRATSIEDSGFLV
jgi:hypothetical protein